VSRTTGLIDIAAAVGDGAAVDWAGVESALDSAERAVLDRLRLVERIASVHAGRPPLAAFERSLHDSQLYQSVVPLDPDLAVPNRWGPLTILDKIGSGTFADVYHARDPRLDRSVALKLLRHRSGDETARESEAIDEARLLARVRHPNVVTVYGADRVDGRVGLWMEFVAGRTLNEELRERGPFESAAVIEIGIALCRALQAVHDAGLLHRDVKAQNVMRDADGRVLLTDFGAGRDATLAGARELAGTPLYLAPELLSGGSASIATDVYSLGVLLYHLATGSFPVQGRSVADLRDAHDRGALVPLRLARPDLPAALCSAIDRAIASDLGQRYPSPAEFERALHLAAAPRRRSRRLVVAAVLSVAAVASAFVAWRRHGSAPIPFAARDWVLVVPFENRTAEPLLDDTIAFAFERDLATSTFVNVVPRDRIDNALALMTKPTTTPIDLSIAREIALRDGGIRALIGGRIDNVNGRYELVAQVINPVDGSVRATMSESATEASHILAAVQREALAIRTALGEERNTLAASARSLEHVTTPSLRALQLYSRAAGLMHGSGNWNNAAAEQLLRDSLREDPDFGSAHILLAWAVRNQLRPATEYLPHADEALRLAGTLPDVERYFIIGSVHHLRSETAADRQGELAQAIIAYDSLLTEYPDHLWALGNLRTIYSALGRYDDEFRLLARLAEVQRHDFFAVASLAETSFENGDLANAERHFLRAEPLLTTLPLVPPLPSFARLASSVRLFRAQDAWLHDDAVAARKYVDEAARNFDTLSADYQADQAERLAKLYLELGALDRAEDFARAIPSATPANADRQAGVMALVLWQRGDRARLLQHLRTSARNGRTGAYMDYVDRLIDMGMFTEAQDAAERFLSGRPRTPRTLKWSRYVDERVALESAMADRRPLNADLEASSRGYSDGAPVYIGLTLTLAGRTADALQSRGETARAIALLEETTSRTSRIAAAAQFRGPEWMANRARLGALYRQSGRDREAHSIEEQLTTLLSTGDTNRPFVTNLRSQAEPYIR
jgi:tetratricopeptide (TPR) repeat protein/tRNA A-37 threonylcarbamoyl transferase component Bud32